MISTSAHGVLCNGNGNSGVASAPAGIRLDGAACLFSESILEGDHEQ